MPMLLGDDASDICADMNEIEDILCNSGEDYDKYNIPFVTEYEVILTSDEFGIRESEDTIRLFKGVSLSGGEIGSFTVNSGHGLFVPYDNDAVLFIYKGMNTFRLPVRWEFLATTEGTLTSDTSYFNRELQSGVRNKLAKTMNGLLKKHAQIILTLYNNMLYETNGVIGSCDDLLCPMDSLNSRLVPGLKAVGNLWTLLVELYPSTNITYSLMNEAANGVSQSIMNKYTASALQAIRLTEQRLELDAHFCLVSGIQGNLLQRWFERDANGNSNAENPEFLLASRSILNQSGYALAVHHFFDLEMNGSYLDGECINSTAFKSAFDVYFTRFVNWVIANKQKVFIAEFGAPDTPTCRVNVAYFLDALQLFAYSPTRESGIVGWTVWSADTAPAYITDHGPGRRRSISIAPGGAANTLMWNDALYERYLNRTLLQAIPPLTQEKVCIQMLNLSPYTLVYQEGYLPFQLIGTADVEPGAQAYLYSNSETNTPIGNIGVVYGVPEADVFLVFRDQARSVETRAYYEQENGSSYTITKVKEEECGIVPDSRGKHVIGVRCFVFSKR